MTSPLALRRSGAHFVLLASTAKNFSEVETGVETDGELGTSGSFICNSNWAVYHTSSLHYQTAPRWEIYLTTVILSAKQPSIRTRRWLILSRHTRVYHCLVREIYYSTVPVHCPTDLFIPVESRKDAREALIIWVVNMCEAEIYSVTQYFCCHFLLQVHLPFLDNGYHMTAIPCMLMTWKEKENETWQRACMFYIEYVPKQNEGTSPLLFELVWKRFKELENIDGVINGLYVLKSANVQVLIKPK